MKAVLGFVFMVAIGDWGFGSITFLSANRSATSECTASTWGAVDVSPEDIDHKRSEATTELGRFNVDVGTSADARFNGHDQFGNQIEGSGAAECPYQYNSNISETEISNSVTGGAAEGDTGTYANANASGSSVFEIVFQIDQPYSYNLTKTAGFGGNIFELTVTSSFTASDGSTVVDLNRDNVTHAGVLEPGVYKITNDGGAIEDILDQLDLATYSLNLSLTPLPEPKWLSVFCLIILVPRQKNHLISRGG